MAKTLHGGRLDAAVKKYGGTRDRWLDLSTGINPNGYPVNKLDGIPANIWAELPDDDLAVSVKNAAAKYYAAPAGQYPVIGAGSQQFIEILPKIFKQQRVAIIGYTYQEHGLCWHKAGHEVLVADGLESAVASARIVVVVNPNNPDGDAIDPETLLEYAAKLGAKGGALIVDEAFCDIAPEFSLMAHAGIQGLIILRSIGKFFGLAGMRIGFAFCDEQRREQLENALGLWPVSAPSLWVAEQALCDKSWIKRAHKTIEARSKALDLILQQAGFEILGGTSLYTLVSHFAVEKMVKHLAENHILIRHFPARKDWLRFGLPANASQLKRLSKALDSFQGSA